jgi:hypothetical protein
MDFNETVGFRKYFRIEMPARSYDFMIPRIRMGRKRSQAL